MPTVLLWHTFTANLKMKKDKSLDVLDKYFKGKRDFRTLKILESIGE